MFFFNEELKAIIKNFFSFTEEMIQDLQNMYTQKIIAMTINCALEYIDVHQAEERERLERLIANPSTDPQLLQQIFTFIFELYNKYPELEEKTNAKIMEVNRDLMKDLISKLDDATAQKILAVAEKEIEQINSLENFLKTENQNLARQTNTFSASVKQQDFS